MKTTINIPEDVLEEAIRNTGATTKREAVVKALQEFNRRRRLSELIETFGTFDNFLTNEELETLRSQE